MKHSQVIMNHHNMQCAGWGNYSRFSRRRGCAGKWNQVQQSVLLSGGAVVTCVHPLDSHSSMIVLFALDKTLKSPQTVMGWQSIISHESNRLTRFFRNGLNTVTRLLSRSRDFMSALRQTPSWTSRHWLWLCEAGEQHLKCYWFKRTVLTSYVKSITHQHNLCDCIKNTMNQSVSSAGKTLLFIVQLQQDLHLTPSDATEFKSMLKASCQVCKESMPLHILALHVKNCVKSQSIFKPVWWTVPFILIDIKHMFIVWSNLCWLYIMRS